VKGSLLGNNAEVFLFSDEELQEAQNNMSFSLFDSRFGGSPENYEDKQWLNNDNMLNKQSDNNKIED